MTILSAKKKESDACNKPCVATEVEILWLNCRKRSLFSCVVLLTGIAVGCHCWRLFFPRVFHEKRGYLVLPVYVTDGSYSMG